MIYESPLSKMFLDEEHMNQILIYYIILKSATLHKHDKVPPPLPE